MKIKNDGFNVVTCNPSLGDDQSPFGIAKSMGETISVFANEIRKSDIDLFICLGDRFEMFAAAVL